MTDAGRSTARITSCSRPPTERSSARARCTARRLRWRRDFRRSCAWRSRRKSSKWSNPGFGRGTSRNGREGFARVGSGAISGGALSGIQSKVLEGLHVYQSGASGQPVLLFLHGSPLSGRMWMPQLERLEEFHCLAPDLPEHGQSQAVAPFSMEDTVRRLAAIVRGAAAPEGRAHLIGLSFGGVVAQALMVEKPDVVDHVILSGTSARMSGAVFQAMWLSLALNRPLLRVLSPGALATLVRWQTGIPASVSPLIEDDMKRVDPDSLTRIILATYGGIIPDRHAFARAAPGG